MIEIQIESDTELYNWDKSKIKVDRVPCVGEFVEIPSNAAVYPVEMVKHRHLAPAIVILRTR